MSEARQSIETLRAALAEARASAEDGAEIELAGLEAAAEDAMREARAVPAADRIALKDALLALVQELDLLGAAIARQAHAAAQQRAAAAYAGAGKASTER